MVTRRWAVLVVVAAALLHAESATSYEVSKTFVDDYVAFSALRNAPRMNGTISAAEAIQWQKLKASWRALEKRVDAEYKGER